MIPTVYLHRRRHHANRILSLAERNLHVIDTHDLNVATLYWCPLDNCQHNCMRPSNKPLLKEPRPQWYFRTHHLESSGLHRNHNWLYEFDKEMDEVHDRTYQRAESKIQVNMNDQTFTGTPLLQHPLPLLPVRMPALLTFPSKPLLRTTQGQVKALLLHTRPTVYRKPTVFAPNYNQLFVTVLATRPTPYFHTTTILHTTTIINPTTILHTTASFHMRKYNQLPISM